jgi:ABC-type xylose transport system substrate-binding protein
MRQPGLDSEYKLSRADDDQPAFARIRNDGGMTISRNRARIALSKFEVAQLVAAATRHERNATCQPTP